MFFIELLIINGWLGPHYIITSYTLHINSSDRMLIYHSNLDRIPDSRFTRRSPASRRRDTSEGSTVLTTAVFTDCLILRSQATLYSLAMHHALHTTESLVSIADVDCCYISITDKSSHWGFPAPHIQMRRSSGMGYDIQTNNASACGKLNCLCFLSGAWFQHCDGQ